MKTADFSELLQACDLNFHIEKMKICEYWRSRSWSWPCAQGTFLHLKIKTELCLRNDWAILNQILFCALVQISGERFTGPLVLWFGHYYAFWNGIQTHFERHYYAFFGIYYAFWKANKRIYERHTERHPWKAYKCILKGVITPFFALVCVLRKCYSTLLKCFHFRPNVPVVSEKSKSWIFIYK